ncbi:MAG: hypothetical protein OZSIB_2566 [Candidatus Ozemobacter sibiricus]|uniref:Uncharacterized protein n=1 Tax=Candidatus Ozemobacter sibiricus TaxID=2268124 RepID=A0A367ZU03_9BACT|nr:MAG: hypothetical protein OZSIB_2566 [Candidatus Ozemobacter sibiricus]
MGPAASQGRQGLTTIGGGSIGRLGLARVGAGRGWTWLDVAGRGESLPLGSARFSLILGRVGLGRGRFSIAVDTRSGRTEVPSQGSF